MRLHCTVYIQFVMLPLPLCVVVVVGLFQPVTVYKIIKCIYVTCYVIPAIYSGTYISYIVHVYMSIMSLHYMFLILYRKT